MMLDPRELARTFFVGAAAEARIVLADAFYDCKSMGAASIAIGVFDGVHRGHRELIDAVIRDARVHGSKAVVVTFDPDPDVVVSPAPAQKLMTTADRLHALAQTGVDAVVAVPFSPAVASLLITCERSANWRLAECTMAEISSANSKSVFGAP